VRKRRILISLALCCLATPFASGQSDPLRRLADWGATLRPPTTARPGAEVARLGPGVSIARLDLHPGDRVLRVNGRAITTAADLDEYLLRFRAGEAVAVDILRTNGATTTWRGALPALTTEQLANASISLDSAVSAAGDRVRIIVSRPAASPARTPAVFFVGWLSCDSVEYPFGETDGFGAILRRIAERSGYATVRVDKPGVGDSEGPACSHVDFERELAAYRAGFASLTKYSFIDPSRIAVIGLSNGGGFAPMAANGARVRGYVAVGSWGRSWYEHMVEHERVALTRSDARPPDVDRTVKSFVDFYRLFLIENNTPGQILAAHPEWRAIWTDGPDGQYGRPAAFYQQLQGLNAGAIWQDAAAPVLVLRGSADTVMSRADGEAIADFVNKARPGTAEYREIDGADHLMMRGHQFAGEMIDIVLAWLRQTALK
jgi:alpha-beta hydrolase superfamily lysophospholipase